LLDYSWFIILILEATKHGVAFASSCLSVGKYSGIVSLEDAVFNHGFDLRIKYFFGAGSLPEDTIKDELSLLDFIANGQLRAINITNAIPIGLLFVIDSLDSRFVFVVGRSDTDTNFEGTLFFKLLRS
jgi:hypothetical protein